MNVNFLFGDSASRNLYNVVYRYVYSRYNVPNAYNLMRPGERFASGLHLRILPEGFPDISSYYRWQFEVAGSALINRSHKLHW